MTIALRSIDTVNAARPHGARKIMAKPVIPITGEVAVTNTIRPVTKIADAAIHPTIRILIATSWAFVKVLAFVEALVVE